MATRKNAPLAQFAARTSEPITKAERKIVNPVIFAALGLVLGSARTFEAFEATLTEAQWVAYVPLFDGGASVPATPKASKGGRKSTRKVQPVVSKTATVREFTCGCTGIRQHLSAKNGCGVAAERKAAKANA